MKHFQWLLPGCIFLVAGCAVGPRQPLADESSKVTYNCLRETGTRLELPEGRCVIAPGRAYSREDLRNSGAPTSGEALRRLGAY